MADPVFTSLDASLYDPVKTLKDPAFRILEDGETPKQDANIACFYNEKHQVHLVQKPKPKPAPGQVLLHIRATGAAQTQSSERDDSSGG